MCSKCCDKICFGWIALARGNWHRSLSTKCLLGYNCRGVWSDIYWTKVSTANKERILVEDKDDDAPKVLLFLHQHYWNRGLHIVMRKQVEHIIHWNKNNNSERWRRSWWDPVKNTQEHMNTFNSIGETDGHLQCEQSSSFIIANGAWWLETLVHSMQVLGPALDTQS